MARWSSMQTTWVGVPFRLCSNASWIASRTADGRSANSTRLPRNRMSQRPFWFSTGSWSSLCVARDIDRLTALRRPGLTRDGLALFRDRRVAARRSVAFGRDAGDLAEAGVVADA